MKIGKMTVDVVVDGQLAIAKEFEYPEMSEESWKPYYGMLAENGTKVVNELGGYLVRSDDFTALVDLGFGPADVPEANGIKWYSGKFLDSLRALGVEPEDVTDIFFSHLHFDHIGWASVEGKPVFPNATYRCDQHDWDHFTDPSHVPNPEEEVFPEEMRAANKLGPIKGQLKTWSESGEILPGFSVIRTPGHSPGTTVFKIESDGESAYFIGDVAHHQAELVEDRWQGVSDFDIELGHKARLDTATLLADTGAPFLAAHYKDFAWGQVVRTGSGFAWKPYEKA